MTVHVQNPIAPTTGAVGAVQEAEQAPLTANTYENDFPGLDALGDQDDAQSPTNIKRVESNSPEPRTPEANTEIDPRYEPDNEPEDKGTAVDANGAIPLPYAGPLLPGVNSNNKYAAQSNYDVPMAPACQAASVGAPNASNTMSQHKSLADFEGQSMTFSLNNMTPEQASILTARQEWLPNFLGEGGLATLISLLKSLSQHHFTEIQ